MANIIEHLGVVENINGTHLSVKIIQSSLCTGCSAKGHCSSADRKEKIVDVTDPHASQYQVGDRVMVLGTMSMGMSAVLLAFVYPFILLVASLFIFMAIWSDDLLSASLSLGLLIPYYFILWLNRTRLKQKFLFTIKPIK